MSEKLDMALDSLLNAANENEPELTQELLKKIYLVEKELQFDEDPKARHDKIQKIITDSLNELAIGDE